MNNITLKLLDLENIGTFIWVIGSFVLIAAVTESKKMILNNINNSVPSNNLCPLILTLNGRLLWTIANFIAAFAVTAEQIQREQKILERMPIVSTLIPDNYITIGMWISFLGIFIVLIGDKKRLKENTNNSPVK